MRYSNRYMKNYFEKKAMIPCRESQIKKTIFKSQMAYYDSEMEKSLSKAEFLYQQSKYIKKCWWVFQGLLLMVLWLLLKNTGSGYDDQRTIGVASPLFVLLIIPEIWKNRNTNAMEVEGTTFFSIRQVYAARLILFALVDLALVSLFFIAASCTTKLTLRELAIQFFVPFNVTCCICFRMLYSKRVNAEALALCLCMVWTIVWVQIVRNEAVYEVVSVPVWMALLFLSFLYIGYCIQKGQKNFMENWEVKTLWN